MSKSPRNRNSPAFVLIGFLVFPFILQAITIHVKISAPKQVPVMKLAFPKKTYGLGVKFAFHIQILADPMTKITNIRITEKYNFNGQPREIKDWRRLDTGLSEITLIQCKVQLFRSGLYEYGILVEGCDDEGQRFSRSSSEQINVEELPDETTMIDEEFSPFLINSSEVIFRNGMAVRIDDNVFSEDFKDKARTFVRLPKEFKLTVSGFADRSIFSPAETRTNLALSSNRAVTVASLLARTFGVPWDRLLVKGFGSSNEAYPDKPGATVNRNRRVVITGP